MDYNPDAKVTHHAHDNPVFESPSRKISATSDHADIGPVRKKSILHNRSSEHDGSNSGRSDAEKPSNGDLRCKKISVTDSVYSKSKFPDSSNDDRSWWYLFCLQCRSDDGRQSWKPSYWPKLCPYPFCPTYRQFTRIIVLCLIGIISWCIFYSIVGETAAPPNGQLFQLIFLSICAHLGGWLISLTTLPPLIGMLFTGIIFQNVNIVNIDESFNGICKELRNVALVIILIRAGLDLDPNAMKKLKLTLVKVGIGPWFIEAAVIAVLSVYVLNLSWIYGLLLGSVVAAVSPAVVVSCLFRLRVKGYGVAKGIPTLIIAVSGIDDAISVAGFGIIKSIIFSNSSVMNLIIEGPLSVIGGIGFGVFWGIMSYFTPEKYDPFVIPLRVLLLLAGGMISIFGSEMIGFGGAGPLACVTAAFVSIYGWSKQGWDVEDNPANTAFEIFWMIFEPILFGITGTTVKINQLDANVVYYCVGILLAGIVIRIIATVLLGIGSQLNLKEKIFVAIACMSKATVQAALGPVTLGLVAASSEEYDWAQKMLNVCVLSIVLTAPSAAILMTLLGPVLLTKAKFNTDSQTWRRSHRPSIRDISIIDEEEERDGNDVSYESPKHLSDIKEIA
ncbi:unnamed protein product [Phyllotreta striolata]|uniref:Cation/H+ exchanger transmembrane domain-containing protein n=1 Tax=Phyllotreta striolata TaxID=444603 RepID=A0A9N9TJD4_PHYSR|nr:unnamed protein product [Phyllotreta striolata]